MVRVYSRLQTKRGRYGSSKAKAFAVLRQYQWLPARQLCISTGIGYHSLGRALPRWVGFEYVTRQPILIGGDFEYHLEPKGKKWLSLAAMYLPNYWRFMAELKAWQDDLPDDTGDNLITSPFNEFVSTLDKMIKEFQKNNEKEY